jgi:hypothetical protein
LERQQELGFQAGLTTPQFWHATPAYVYDRMEIIQRQEEREMDRAAWMVHFIMAAFMGSKHAPSIDELRGRVTRVI